MTSQTQAPPGQATAALKFCAIAIVALIVNLIVQSEYTHGRAVYEQEGFVPVREPYADRGVVFLRFNVRESPGTIRARVSAKSERLTTANGAVENAQQRPILLFDSSWKWDTTLTLQPDGALELPAKLERFKIRFLVRSSERP